MLCQLEYSEYFKSKMMWFGTVKYRLYWSLLPEVYVLVIATMPSPEAIVGITDISCQVCITDISLFKTEQCVQNQSSSYIFFISIRGSGV